MLLWQEICSGDRTLSARPRRWGIPKIKRITYYSSSLRGEAEAIHGSRRRTLAVFHDTLWQRPSLLEGMLIRRSNRFGQTLVVAASRTPSAFMTPNSVESRGSPSLLSARLSASRDRPASFAILVMPLAREAMPSARAKKAGSPISSNASSRNAAISSGGVEIVGGVEEGRLDAIARALKNAQSADALAHQGRRRPGNPIATASAKVLFSGDPIGRKHGVESRDLCRDSKDAKGQKSGRRRDCRRGRRQAPTASGS